MLSKLSSQLNKHFVYKLQSIHPQSNQEQITHEANELNMLHNWKQEPIEVFKKIKQLYQCYRR